MSNKELAVPMPVRAACIQEQDDVKIELDVKDIFPDSVEWADCKALNQAAGEKSE